MKVTNRFKGLDLIDRRTTDGGFNIVQGAVIRIILKEKKCSKVKWFSEKALQIGEKRREIKGKEKGKDTPN